MSWYNNFLATPLVGIRFSKTAKFIPLLEKIIFTQCGEEAWVIRQGPSHKWNAKYKDLNVNLEPGHVSIIKNYSFEIENQIGKMPTLILPEPTPFEKLLEDVLVRMKNLWKILCEIQGETPEVDFIGCVLNVDMPLESAPPGAVSVFNYLEKPWENGLTSFNGNFSTILEENENYKIRCSHRMQVNNVEPAKMFKMNLDFQKCFKTLTALDESRLSPYLDKVAKSAIEYFSEFGKVGIKNG